MLKQFQLMHCFEGYSSKIARAQFEQLTLYMGLASLIAVATMSIVYVKYRKKRQT